MTSQIIGASVDFHENVGTEGLIIQHSQEIPTEWIDRLKAEKAESNKRPAGNFHRAASIPVVVFEKWMREGYDPQHEPIARTLAKLQAEGLDHFITTEKAL